MTISEFFKEKYSARKDKENIYGVGMSDTEFRHFIIQYLLPENWYVVDPIGQSQINEIAINEILTKYSKRFRHERKKCLKELGGGEVAPKMDTKVANRENAISFLKKRFPNKIQMFDTRNFAGDRMITIYDSNGVVIDYCPDYDYIEIFGLTDDEFAIVVKECGDN